MVKEGVIGASSAGGLSVVMDTVQSVATGLLVWGFILLVEMIKTKITAEKIKRKELEK